MQVEELAAREVERSARIRKVEQPQRGPQALLVQISCTGKFPYGVEPGLGNQ